MTNLAKTYNDKFYLQKTKSYLSAKEFLPYLFDSYKPRSMVDFGCGVGPWLTVASELGVTDLLGIDGEWIEGKQLNTDKINYKLVDLEQPIRLEHKFDLAISLEVAEHLSEKRAKSFVADICNAADVIMFGAAIKGQGGVNHINEQWQSYWVDLFKQNDYDCIDFFRSKFWNSQIVSSDYVQNAFLFVKKDSEKRNLFEERIIDTIYDCCHPDIFNRYRYPKNLKYCSLRTYIRTTPRIPLLIFQALWKRIKRD